MHPAQALETWWDCTNPMPELAGLYSITKRLAVLPDNLTSESDRKFWSGLSAKLPELPLRETPSGIALAPAERFKDKQNVENPELYAVFPFRLFGVGNPNIECWNADFKLHAPYNTVIEGSVKNGKIERLKVTPESRKKDVIIK